MSLTTTRLLSAGEAALALRLGLWNRQWRDFLADCIRGKGGLCGWLILEPFAVDEQGHPLYHPADVRMFIKTARSITPSSKLNNKVVSEEFVHDDTIGLPWRMRVARPAAGAPSRA